MSDVIQQHYVSQFILREFVAPDGMLEVMERGKSRSFRSKPDRVACERFYNATLQPDGTIDTQSVEKRLSEIETCSAPLMRKLVAGEGLSADERKVLSNFIAIQDFRSLRKRQEYSDLILAVEHHKLRAQTPTSVEEMLRLVRNACENPKQFELEARFEDAGLRFDGDGTVCISREETMAALNAAAHFGPVISEMKWTLFQAEKTFPFIISDSPVVLWENPKTLEKHAGPAYWRPGTLVSLPLSPTIMFVASYASETSFVAQLESERVATQAATNRHVRFFNELQILGAHRYVYATTDNDGLRRKIARLQPRETAIAFAPRDASGNPISVHMIRPRNG